MKKIIVSIIFVLSIFTNISIWNAYQDTRIGRWLWWVRVINEATELKLNKIIYSVSQENRVNFIKNIITKIDNLERKIQNSSSKADSKLKNLAFLWEIRDILEWILNDLNITSYTNNASLSYNITQSISSISWLNININSSTWGKWYYVVLPINSYSPKPEQIRSWFDYYWNIAWVRWITDMKAWNNQINITWLNQNTNYVFYFVAEDQYGNLNSTILNSTFLTSDINSSYSWQIGLSINSITWTTLNATVSTNTSWKAYYVVLPDNAVAPNASQIRAWMWGNWMNTNYKWTLSLSVWINQFSVPYLSSNTYYKLYLIEDDANWNSLYNTLILPFATWENVWYSWPNSSYYSVNISSLQIGVTSASAIVNASQNGKWYYLVLPKNSISPTPSRIKEWTDSNWNYVSIKWSMNLTKWENLLTISWLVQNTEYVLYYAYEDTYGNLVSNTISLSIKTSYNSSVDSQIINVIINPSWTSLGWVVNTNLSWRWYWIVLPSWANKPTSLQVKEWIDSKWNSVSIKWNVYMNVWDNSFNMTWLNVSSNYVLYFTSIDASRNLLANPVAIPFNTK